MPKVGQKLVKTVQRNEPSSSVPPTEKVPAVETCAKWVHFCYQESAASKPGRDTPWADLPKETKDKYRALARVMLEIPLEKRGTSAK